MTLPDSQVAQSVYHYIDLGTGSMIIQVLIASSVGILFVTKAHIKNIITKIKSFKDKRENENQ